LYFNPSFSILWFHSSPHLRTKHHSWLGCYGALTVGHPPNAQDLFRAPVQMGHTLTGRTQHSATGL
jgi:hypothetical protein